MEELNLEPHSIESERINKPELKLFPPAGQELPDGEDTDFQPNRTCSSPNSITEFQIRDITKKGKAHGQDAYNFQPWQHF